MNRRMVAYRLGQLLMLESVLFLLPIVTALIYQEWLCLICFVITAAAAMIIGFLIRLFFKPKSQVIYAKEGFVLVTLAWLVMSLVGAVPFTASGEIPNYIDAVFETVSGFTTTGATIVTDVEKLSRSILLWRSFTHWIGGMGVLVLMMAIISTDSGRSIHILRAEMAGPVVGKLVPKVRNTAKILYIIYLALTVLQILFLLPGGMSLYDSIIHALGTAGTGGFGIRGDSLGSYNPYVQWVITVFMCIFSINFNLFYLLVIGKVGMFFKNTELWCYFGIVLTAGIIVSCSIIPIYGNVGDSVRHGFFQVASISSTTGYSSADFNLWPPIAKAVLFILMFFGGCAGSTAGGLKISRVMILFRMIKRDVGQMLSPRSVNTVKLEGKTVDAKTLNGVSAYFALYVTLIASTFLLISFEKFDFETNLSAAVSCCNNVGPGFGMVGPVNSYADYSDFSTIVLTFSMLLGRLEIFPVLLALNPRVWYSISKKKSAASLKIIKK